jgi:glycolate oxidase
VDCERRAREVAAAAGDDAIVPADELDGYAADSSGAPSARPAAAVRPADAIGVARVLETASRLSVPVVPAGGRTGLAGGANADGASVVLSLERLDWIGPVERGNQRLTVGAGARTADVQAAALAAGLFYPPDPASLERSTIGGNVATNAGGPRCFKYGVTAEYVLSLEAVSAAGRIFRTGAATRKNTAGPRLAQLLVGSEGTLAVVTEATLRLIAAPEARLATTARFGALESAGEAVAAVVASGLLPSALELVDRTCLELLGLPGDAMVIVEVDGPDVARAQAELELVVRVLRDAGAEAVETAADAEAVERLWQARRELPTAFAAAAPDLLLQDVCVPPAAVPGALRRIAAVAARHGLAVPVFGHAGDGNLHSTVLYDAAAGESGAAHSAEADVLQVALELGGTIAAEHGVGTLKRPFLASALDPGALDMMRAVKAALDPLGILNPEKVLP